MVEFALVAVIFFTMVLAIIEFGRAFMLRHQLNDAARVGCRTAILQGKSSQNIKDVVTAYLQQSGITSQTTTVKVNGAEGEALSAPAEAEITVVVSVPMEKVTWLPGMKYVTGTLTGQFTMRRE